MDVSFDQNMASETLTTIPLQVVDLDLGLIYH